MLTSDQLPGDQKLPWTGSQTDFVTLVLAMSPQFGTADEIGEKMLQQVDINIAPYPDFHSMRLALEKDCDPQAFMQKGREALQADLLTLEMLNGTGASLAPETGDEQESTLSGLVETLNDWGISPKTMKPFEPAIRFAILPSSPEGKITWNAPLTDFVALVILTAAYGIIQEKDNDIALDKVAERYFSFIDIDLSPWSDFRSLYIVHQPNIDLEILMDKARSLEEEFDRSFGEGSAPGIQPFSPFMVQAMYNYQMAQEFAKRWSIDDCEGFSHLFDMLFIPDKIIGKPGW